MKIYIWLDIHINVLMAPQNDYVRMYNHCDHDEGVVYEVSPSYAHLSSNLAWPWEVYCL